MPLETILSVKDLWVTYGEKIAVEDVSYDVKKGDLVGVVGANGSGKSSMFKAVLGLLPYRGSVRMFDKEFHRNLLRMVGYVPQKITFDLTFPATVFDVVAMGLMRGRSNKDNRRDGIANSTLSDSEKVKACLEAVRMWHLRRRRIGALSGGEMQRVFIAQSLVRNPLLLIMDEPAVGLDVRSEKLFYSILQEAHTKHNITVMVALHDIDAVEKYSNKVVCINRSLYFYGDTTEFFADEKLLGAYTEYSMQAHIHKHPHMHSH